MRKLLLLFLLISLILSSPCLAQKVDVWGPNGLSTGSQNPYTGNFTIMDDKGIVIGQKDVQGNWSIMDLGNGTVDRNSAIINKFMEEDREYKGYGRD